MENFGNFDVNSFDFGTMTQDKDPFESPKKSYTDDRFYVLPKKSDGTGHAVVALMPDRNKNTIIRMFKINTTVERNGQKRFLNAWSPKTINQPCPFNETYINHWDEDHDMARRFKPTERWVCNIKVIKDPEKPENEGKIFLYEMSKTMAQKIQETLTLTKTDIDMGVSRKELFNPFKGWILNLKCYKKDGGMTSYDNSDFTQLPQGRSIYNLNGELTEADKKRGIEDILNNTYDLSELQKPENFKSYEELTTDLKNICRGLFGIGESKGGTEININNAPTNAVNSEVVANTNANALQSAPSESVQNVATPKKEENLDDFLSKL